MVDACLKLLDLAYFEVTCAFEGLPDEHVWKRPAPELLSIGELAAHHAFWEAVRLACDGPDPSNCRISSPFVDPRFRYYPITLETPPTEAHLAMTAEQVLRELQRVHEEAISYFRELNPDPDSRIPACHNGFTYVEYLKYAVFHLSYHTGQMYSVRHLLGEQTPDN